MTDNTVASCVSCPRMQNWGLNTYLYGPKDDLKHRLLWREVYSPEEEGKRFLFFLFVICQSVAFLYERHFPPSSSQLNFPLSSRT